AFGVPLGKEDRVGRAVRDRGGNLVDPADLPVLVPAAAEDVPVGGVADGPAAGAAVAAAAPEHAARGQARVARGQEGLDDLVGVPGVGPVTAVAVDLRVLVHVVLLDER